MSDLTLSLLGPVIVCEGDRSLLPFRSVKVEALLIYLAVGDSLGRRAPYRREELMELLWPGMPEGSARQNLRQTLYLLRQALPQVEGAGGENAVPLLLSNRQTVQIYPEAHYSLDVAAFSQAVQLGTMAALEEAAALYRGVFLADFYLEDSNPFEEWAASNRARFQQMAVDVLAQLAEYYEHEGALAEAERVGERWAELDPLTEGAQGVLLRVRARAGEWMAALRGYQNYVSRLKEEMGVEPSAHLQTLSEQVRTRTWSPPARRVTQAAAEAGAEEQEAAVSLRTALSLPQPLTGLVGRGVELEQLGAYLAEDGARLITITGPGGAGKSRLAIEAGVRFAALFPDGVFFVALEGVEHAERVPTAVASSLGFAFHGSVPAWQQLAAFLGKKRLLLILDNLEDLLQAGGQLVGLLQGAPGLKLLVTSQERLNVRGEWLLQIEGLAFEREPAEATGAPIPARQLFVACARRVRPDFALTETNREAINHICRLVQGMPLAIELAAAWTRLLSCDEIAREIEENLDFVSSAATIIPARQRSLRAVFDYAWQRLDEEEQALVAHLAIFRGGFTQEAAAEVAGATLYSVAELLDKSLLRIMPAGAAAGRRFQMHAHLRRYALEKLQARPDAAETALWHASFYARFAAEVGQQLRGRGLLEAIAAFTIDIDNLRAAWQEAAARRALALLEAMVEPLLLFYEVRSWFAEGFAQFGRFSGDGAATRSDEERRVLAYARAGQGWFMLRLADYDAAAALLEQSLSLLAPLDDPRGEAFVLSALALVHNSTGAYTRAQRRAEASLARCHGVDDPLFKAFSLHNLGSVARMQSDFVQARTHYRETLKLFRAIDNHYGRAFTLLSLAHIDLLMGRLREAHSLYVEGWEACRQIGYRYGEAVALRSLSEAALALGFEEEAKHFCEQGLVLAQALGDEEGRAWAELVLARVLGTLGEVQEAEGLAAGSRDRFLAVGHQFGRAVACGHLGALRTATGDDEGAYRAVAESLDLFEKLGNRWGVFFARTKAGWAALARDAEAEAAAAFACALELAETVVARPLLLECLAGVATLHARRQEWQQATALAALMREHRAAPAALRQEMESFLAGLEQDGVMLPAGAGLSSAAAARDEARRWLRLPAAGAGGSRTGC